MAAAAPDGAAAGDGPAAFLQAPLPEKRSQALLTWSPRDLENAAPGRKARDPPHLFYKM
jgi:hypothetical protein